MVICSFLPVFVKVIDIHFVKSVRIRSFLVRIFPHFSLSLRILSECGKIRARKTPNIDTFTKWFPATKLGWTSLLSFDHLLPLWLEHLSPEAELIQEGWESFEP